MSTNSIKKNALLNIIYTVSNILFPLITFPYVSRVLGADYMGKVNFFSTLASYAVMLASLGISTYGIRATAKERDDPKQLTKVAQELFTINTIATIVILILLVLLGITVPKFRLDWQLLLINSMLILFSPIGMNWLYSGLEQYSYITKRALIFKTIALILVFILVKGTQDYLMYAAIVTFSSVGSFVCNFVFARKYISFKPVQLDLAQHMKPMLLLFGSILAINVYTHLDTVMLGFIGGDKEVGYYTVAVYAKTALLTLINAISVVLLPRMSYYIKKENKSEVNRILKRSITTILVIAVPMTVFFIISAKETVLILGGKGFLPAIPCMQIIMPILIISGISNITGNQILIPNGLDSRYMMAVSSGAVVDFILNLLLMPRLKCIGAAIATLIAEIIQMSIQMYYSRTSFIPNINMRSIIKIIIAAGIAGIIIILLKTSITINVIVLIFILAMVYFSVYFGVLLALKESETIHLLKALKGLIKRA